MNTRLRPRPKPRLTAPQRMGVNVRKLREKKFGTVERACQASGFTIPRWYRLEQGTYPRMMGVVIDQIAELFGVEPADLVR